MTQDLPFLVYPLAVDFANSVGMARTRPSGDLLANAEAFRRWLEVEGEPPWPGEPPLDALHALRADVTSILGAAARDVADVPMDAVERVNAASRAAPLVPTLEPETLVARTLVEAPDAATSLMGRIAQSAIEVVGSHARRLQVCTAPGCELFYVATRDGQAWCSRSCGNRARVARHYARRRKH